MSRDRALFNQLAKSLNFAYETVIVVRFLFLGSGLFAKMKGFVFWVLVCVAAFLSFSTDGTTSSVPDAHLIRHGNDMIVLQNRKLKDNGQVWSPKKIDDERDTNLGLEDYNHIDPVPSSKASIKPAPIQHGTPFMPYLPKPAPGPPPKA